MPPTTLDRAHLMTHAETTCDDLEKAHRFLERAAEVFERVERRVRRLDIEIEGLDGYPYESFRTRVSHLANEVQAALEKLEHYTADVIESEE